MVSSRRRLFGTTVKSVRYYDQLGLEDEPRWLKKAYKQDKVRHLGRLLWSKCPTGLGVTLDQIKSI